MSGLGESEAGVSEAEEGWESRLSTMSATPVRLELVKARPNILLVKHLVKMLAGLFLVGI